MEYGVNLDVIGLLKSYFQVRRISIFKMLSMMYHNLNQFEDPCLSATEMLCSVSQLSDTHPLSSVTDL